MPLTSLEIRNLRKRQKHLFWTIFYCRRWVSPWRASGWFPCEQLSTLSCESLARRSSGTGRPPTLSSVWRFQSHFSRWTYCSAPAFTSSVRSGVTLCFSHLKSVPVSSLLPDLVNTKPALGTLSRLNVAPVRPRTGWDRTSLPQESRAHIFGWISNSKSSSSNDF